MDLFFSDHFKVKRNDLDKYGAFNISLVSDLPLFIDPFLLFNSKKKKYKELHESIIKYLVFLKDKSASQTIDTGALKAWYVFKEVEQNWLGFSLVGNKGSALGMDFGRALNENLYKLFQNFGTEKKKKIAGGSHLEKLCLIRDGVGRDNISDFTTNLIKEFLLEYTQAFAQKHIDANLRDKFRIPKTRFNYSTETWEEAEFDLPKFNNDFVLLTPKELLTKDETWINKADLYEHFDRIPNAIPDDQLRSQINNYFLSRIPRDPKKKKEPTQKEKAKAALETLYQYPELIDYYIKQKEETGEQAENISSEKVSTSENLYVNNVKQFIPELEKTEFYASAPNSFEEAKKKIGILKEFIENNDGYKLFYAGKERVKNEHDLHLLFGLVCHKSTTFDVNREPNNGRGPVDFKISKGSADKTLVEFKLAGNKKLEQNLKKQVEIYEKANGTKLSFKVIVYFSKAEYERVIEILNRLKLNGKENVILIDARLDNKVSASNVK
jgi:hypothetical protein